MNFRNYITLTGAQERAQEEKKANYTRFFTDPVHSHPAIHINVPVEKEFTIREQSHDPVKMLKSSLDAAKMHLEVGDDFLPNLRIEFGTGQVAHAFGCGLYEPEDSPCCAEGHVLHSSEEVESLELPSLTAGLFGKLEEYTAYYKENAPEFLPIILPDLQGPFNNAHLVRGNDILFDFYDDPEAVDLLLSKMTDYQIALTHRLRKLNGAPDGVFYDWGCLWKGALRICNCSLHMISTEFYTDFIQKYDQKLLDEFGGGRIHYCGTHDDGLFDSFFRMPRMHGVDYDGAYHDFWDLAQRTPADIPLLQYMTPDQVERLLSGDWPKKNNVIVQVSAPSMEEGKVLLRRLRESMPKEMQELL